MSGFWQRPFWRRARVCWRWMRVACWVLLLAVLCSLVYLNRVGLPPFLKRRFVEELHSRGIDFQYGQMRLDFYGGIVAEQVRFGGVDDTNSPELFIESVGLQFSPRRLLRRRELEVESLVLQGGRITLPVGASNGPPASLVVEGLDARVSLLPGDVWQVHELRARSLGAHFDLAGTLTNASAIQDWKFGGGRGGRAESAWREYLRRTIDIAGRLRFRAVPEVRGHWRADAADPMRALARLELHANGARTPWGDAEKFTLDLHSVPATNKDDILGARVELKLNAASTRWGKADTLVLRTQTRPVETPGAWPGGGLTIEAAQPDTPWGRAQSLRINFTLADVQTNLTSLRGHLDLTAQQPKTKWASAQWLHLTARAAQLPPGTVSATDAAWGWWADLAPYELDWQLQAESVATVKGDLDHLEAAGHWRAPDLAVDDLTASVLGGKLLVAAKLNVASRDAIGRATIDFDVKKLDRLLTEGAQKWLSQYEWDHPPIASARGGGKLPPWTAENPDWRGEVLPTVWLDGALTNQAGAFRGVRFDRARLDFHFTNQIWRVRDIVAERPEGRVWLDHDSNERTKDYSFKVRSSIDVKALRPWLDDGGKRALDFFQFTGNPDVEVDLWGRWHALERTGFNARMHATNFTFRGETVSEVSAAVAYTNRSVSFRDARLRRPEGEAVVAAGRFDIDAQKLFLTNAVSTVEPMAVLRAIGPRTAEAMEPYQFLAPPKVTVNGIVHTRDTAQMDLQFHAEGGPFHWSRFNLPTVTADLHWASNGLVMTNFEGAFYDGKIRGAAWFNFSRGEGTQFSFDANVWESDLHKLMSDISPRTNKLAGVLNGRLAVTSADSSDWTSWQGAGDAKLRDGLLWDVPLFGFLSGPLNTIMPGVGHSRADAASATYMITNSVIRTDDLKIEAGTALLKYRGTVDFDTRVNAHVEAEVLRETGIIGKIVNLALMPLTKLLEYKVTGTLADPKPEPLYVLPRIILMPLNPVKTIKELFPGESKPPATNAPPAPAQPPQP